MTSDAKPSAYMVSFEHARRLTVPEWLAVERGQVSENVREVNAALLALVDEIEGHRTPARSASTFAVLCDELYGTLVETTGLSRYTMAPPNKKSPKLKAADAIRMKASVKRVEAERDEFKIAASKGSLFIKRFLSNDLYEVRGLVLMWYAQCLIAQTDTNAANELDVVIQKFLTPAMGRRYINPAKLAAPSPAMLVDLNWWHRRLRSVHPFNGVQLAVMRPQVVWRTMYDNCLPTPPICARENQRNTMTALADYAARRVSFILLNRAPPGAGKSALLVPIARLLARPGTPDIEKLDLYVCAGQGLAGVIQFMQALYGAGIPFAAVCVEHEKLQIVRQHSNRSGACRVFVGTADAICLLATQPTRRGWLIIDEPTYGADVAGSDTTAALMRLLAKLPAINRRVVLLGATLPIPADMPNIMAHFGNTFTEIDGGQDAIQIACDVRTDAGAPVHPHTGCTSGAHITATLAKVATKPFFARMYDAKTLVNMCAAGASAGASAGLPDLAARFASAANLKPEVVARTTNELLAFMATQTSAVITAVSTPARATSDPLSFAALFTTAPTGHQAMIVDVDPLAFAMRECAPLLATIRRAGIPTANDMYTARGKITGALSKAAAAA
jgi:hypothetical protein